MKKYYTILICSFILLLGSVLNTSASEKLLLLTDHRPPFEYMENGKLKGVAAENVIKALDAMQWPYEIKTVPWKRAQKSVEDGKAHGFFAASKNKKRDSYATLSAIVADQYWNWYVLKSNSLNPENPSFKKKARVGSWDSSNSLKWLKREGYNITASPKLTSQLVRMLKKDRLDAMFGSNFAIEKDLEELKIMEKIKIFKGLHKPMGVYFSNAFLKRNPTFLELFNKQISQNQ